MGMRIPCPSGVSVKFSAHSDASQGVLLEWYAIAPLVWASRSPNAKPGLTGILPVNA